MLQKPLVLAVIATSLAVGSVPTDASANGDPLLGALVGAGIGAAVGHGVNGRDGAWVGGALGAITGASIAASSGGYYDQGYYGAPANSYAPAPAYYGTPSTHYAPAPAYYAPAPTLYAPPVVTYRPRPIPIRPYAVYAQPYPGRYPAYGRPYEHGRRYLPDHGRYRGPDRYDRGGR